MLDPRSSILIEGGDAIRWSHELRTASIGGRANELQYRVLGGTVIPRWQWGAVLSRSRARIPQDSRRSPDQISAREFHAKCQRALPAIRDSHRRIDGHVVLATLDSAGLAFGSFSLALEAYCFRWPSGKLAETRFTGGVFGVQPCAVIFACDRLTRRCFSS